MDILITLLAFFLIVYGIWAVFNPTEAWWLQWWGRYWEFRSMEPSDTALIVSRIQGIITAILGFVILVLLILKKG